MTDPPDVDGRDREQLRAGAASIAPAYTDEWDPDSADAGTVLLELFADMAADVVERLDRVPKKHRLSFLDTLGFEQEPPQPAELPVSLTIADGADGNVRIPSGIETVAPETDDRPEQVFQVIDGFEATPANLQRVYSLDPASDRIFDHRTVVGGSAESQLFGGIDVQRHALYLSHPDLLTLLPGDDLRIRLRTDAPAAFVETCLVWE
jgi:hypothetical protein